MVLFRVYRKCYLQLLGGQPIELLFLAITEYLEIFQPCYQEMAQL